MAAAASELTFWATCPAAKVEAMPEAQSNSTGAVGDYSTLAGKPQWNQSASPDSTTGRVPSSRSRRCALERIIALHYLDQMDY